MIGCIGALLDVEAADVRDRRLAECLQYWRSAPAALMASGSVVCAESLQVPAC